MNLAAMNWYGSSPSLIMRAIMFSTWGVSRWCGVRPVHRPRARYAGQLLWGAKLRLENIPGYTTYVVVVVSVLTLGSGRVGLAACCVVGDDTSGSCRLSVGSPLGGGSSCPMGLPVHAGCSGGQAPEWAGVSHAPVVPVPRGGVAPNAAGATSQLARDGAA